MILQEGDEVRYRQGPIMTAVAMTDQIVVLRDDDGVEHAHLLRAMDDGNWSVNGAVQHPRVGGFYVVYVDSRDPDSVYLNRKTSLDEAWREYHSTSGAADVLWIGNEMIWGWEEAP